MFSSSKHSTWEGLNPPTQPTSVVQGDSGEATGQQSLAQDSKAIDSIRILRAFANLTLKYQSLSSVFGLRVHGIFNTLHINLSDSRFQILDQQRGCSRYLVK